MADFDFSNPPINFEELSDSELGKKWEKQCNKRFYEEGWVRLGKIKAVFSRNFLRYYERIRDFQTQPDDIWVASFPKCEMVYCIATELDFEAAKISLPKRFPYFELHANWCPNLTKQFSEVGIKNSEGADEKLEENKKTCLLDSFDQVDQLERPRFIKTHLHYSLLPEAMKKEGSPKMVYVVRNPKDACVSFYHHVRLVEGYAGSLDDFVEAFVADNVLAAPFWTHVREYWEIRDRPNVLLIKYEDMKRDLPSVIRKTAAFLEKKLTDEQVDKLTDHLSFESMRQNPSVNYEELTSNMQHLHGTFCQDLKFMRKGQVGSHKEEMTPEMVEKLDDWMSKNKIVELYEH